MKHNTSASLGNQDGFKVPLTVDVFSLDKGLPVIHTHFIGEQIWYEITSSFFHRGSIFMKYEKLYFSTQRFWEGYRHCKEVLEVRRDKRI